jgi:hypothetical protein
MTRPLESDIKAGILRYLRSIPGLTVRNIQTFGIPGRINSAKGTPDIVMCWKGRVVWLEVKRPGQKPSPEQETFIFSWRNSGGEAYVVYSLEDVDKIVKGPQLRMKFG